MIIKKKFNAALAAKEGISEGEKEHDDQFCLNAALAAKKRINLTISGLKNQFSPFRK